MATSSTSNQPIQFTHQINTTLTANNYILWKSQIIAILRGHGLIGFIDGSKEPPSSTISSSKGCSINPEFSNWYKQDQLVLAWIFNSLFPSILTQVINCKSSRHLWIELNQLHTDSSMARILELKLKLQTSKKGGATCAQFFQHMQGLADQLRSTGSTTIDQELVLYILQGLGTDFANFATAISLRPGSVTMSELRSLLLSHEALQQASLTSLSSSMAHLTVQMPKLSSTGSDSSSHSAFYTGNRPPPNQRNYSPNQRRGKGSYRGKGRERSSSSQTDTIQCQICSKWRHSVMKCYHRFDISYTQQSGANSTLPSSSAPQALLAQPNASPTQDWFLDFGVTTHVTNDLNNLSSSMIYSGTDMVHMRN